jgi:heme exporter protein D
MDEDDARRKPMSFSEFVHMGGYGFYVWNAYGAVALLFVFNTVIPILRHRRLLRDARKSAGENS